MLKRTKALLALDLLARSAPYDDLMGGPVTSRSGLEALAATFRRFRERLAKAGPDLDHEIVNRLAEGLMDETQGLVERLAVIPADQVGEDFWRIDTASQRLPVALPHLAPMEIQALERALLGDIKAFARRFLEIEASGMSQDGRL